MNRSNIEEGYTLINAEGEEYIVVTYKNKQHIVNPLRISGSPIDIMMDSELNATNDYIQIVEIKNKQGKTVWKKPTELTMQEIADKFGIPVEQLKIKK